MYKKSPLLLFLTIMLMLAACAPGDMTSTQRPPDILETSEVSSPRGYITFAVNVHDWVHSDESAETLLRLIDIFEKYGVRGDFYLTAPVTREYVEKYPEVIQRLKESGMTISYHVRAPHPLVSGFGAPLEGLEGEALLQAIRDYETYRLDMTTGGLDRSQPGGYAYVAEVFGVKPVVASASGGTPQVASAARQVYAEMGAQMTVIYHESGLDIEQPFEYVDGLLVRPVDFSATRVTLENGKQNFWWNLMSSKYAAEADPVNLIQNGLAEWEAQAYPRPPFIIAHIHENNFYRSGSAAWGSYYYEIDSRGNKTDPLSPPFDLNAPDPSTPRSPDEQEAIWQAYEAMVAWAAENLQVVTSEDIVQMAQQSDNPSTTSTPGSGEVLFANGFEEEPFSSEGSAWAAVFLQSAPGQPKSTWERSSEIVHSGQYSARSFAAPGTRDPGYSCGKASVVNQPLDIGIGDTVEYHVYYYLTSPVPVQLLDLECAEQCGGLKGAPGVRLIMTRDRRLRIDWKFLNWFKNNDLPLPGDAPPATSPGTHILPLEEWFEITLRMTLANQGEGLTEVYVNGELDSTIRGTNIAPEGLEALDKYPQVEIGITCNVAGNQGAATVFADDVQVIRLP